MKEALPHLVYTCACTCVRVCHDIILTQEQNLHKQKLGYVVATHESIPWTSM